MGHILKRWCGICFCWQEEKLGRCVQCGNAHMTGGTIKVATKETT